METPFGRTEPFARPAPPTFFERVKQAIGPLLLAGYALVKFAPFLLKTGGTMLISIVVYAQIWGWWYAAGFVLLIFVHELGHLVAARMMGLDVGLPVFIPFMGAIIALKEAPRNAWIEAIVGIGGPILGSVGALAVGACYLATGNALFLALAYSGFFLNLFNLVPIVPLDGGRIVSAVSPWLWVIGLAILVPVMLWSWNILLILLVVLSLPRVFGLFRRRSEEERRYFECTPAQRWTIALLYFALLVGLGFAMTETHHMLQERIRPGRQAEQIEL